jgi:hypothetical protein
MPDNRRFPPEKIQSLARRYVEENTDQVREERIIGTISPRVRGAGFYTKPDFLELCLWKTPRTQSRCQRNDDAFIGEVTRIALGTQNERLRIEGLTLLSGVGWPTASVLLHFGHRDPYPILDFRALWSLEIPEPPEYTFEFWWKYVLVCRELSSKHNADIRTIDRALWQFSKENQKA